MHAVTALLVLALIASPAAVANGDPGSGAGASRSPKGWSIWAKETSPGRAPVRPAPVRKAKKEVDADCAPMVDGFPQGSDDFYCGLIRPGGGAGVTPQMLVGQAVKELALPLPQVSTAPPRGRPGMVGIRQWFWLNGSGQWTTKSKRVHVGAVWAEVTASPRRLLISPGAGLPDVVCDGPGTPYDPHRPPQEQDSGCTYLYERSSAGQPRNAYRVSVTVVWGATWRGSGGAGGPLAPISRSTSYALTVAEAQALVTD